MGVGCKTDGEFLSLFRRFYRSPPSNASVELLKKLALELWYGDLDTEKLVNSELSNDTISPLQARRAIYLVDRMISFPCLSRSKAKALRNVVKMREAQLKIRGPSKRAKRLFREHKLDKKALANCATAIFPETDSPRLPGESAYEQSGVGYRSGCDNECGWGEH